ncbi:cation:proton antiporter domain-containing protein [Saccharolobus shibatae]|uniref:Sodium/hydrogen exchanger family protein n=1 Tax=Saccharolobus shibatae TaxID=2286 RepID=A0A8F5BT40_9CREN|nr:cation:proton antiporter [Saccharolobus shibatae]QXJ30981.1 Sodium/hydrogen exchanger family protein [Saccharolobus shibatae]QXJ34016.1 Sodium/hydrogen exchanger family protein [Saccharolobus shibatae]
MDYGLLSLMLLFTLLFAFILTRLKVSPVIAYLLGGLIAFNYFHFDFNSSYFEILNFLALNLLAFEIGTSFDISRAKELFRRAIGIALTELILILLISYFIGLYLLHLDPFGSLFLVMASIDTSTSILYKIAGNKLDKNDRDLLIAVASVEDVEVFFLYSVAIAINGYFNFFRTFFVVLEVFIASLIIYAFAKYFLTGLSIFRLTSLEDESILILLPIVLIFVFEYISQVTQVPTTLTMILAGIAFSSISGSEKVLKYTAPIREFALIFFFLSVGSYLKITSAITTFILISFIILIIKYFSFSTASWVTGTTFVKAFTNGLYMLPLSEFGIIVSLQAIQQGVDIAIVYYISVVVVLVSSIIASILSVRVNVLQRIIGIVYSRSYFLRQLDSTMVWFNKTLNASLSPILRSVVFRGFVKMFLYLILPYVLFPIINSLVTSIIDPINNLILQYVLYAGEIAIALFLLYLFLSQGSRLYSTINNQILVKIAKVRSRLFREFWFGLTSFSSTFYSVILTVVYITFEIIPLLYNFPIRLVFIPLLVSLYFIYRYRVPPITFTRISNKNREELVKLSLKVIKRMRKKRRPKGISRIIRS